MNSPPRNALRVLVVEDDALITMLYAELMTEMGHVVCAIETIEADAVAAATRHKPDLMIVDVGLREAAVLPPSLRYYEVDSSHICLLLVTPRPCRQRDRAR